MSDSVSPHASVSEVAKPPWLTIAVLFSTMLCFNSGSASGKSVKITSALRTIFEINFVKILWYIKIKNEVP